MYFLYFFLEINPIFFQGVDLGDSIKIGSFDH